MEQLHQEHLAVVVWILAMQSPDGGKRPRGIESQRERRKVESKVRIRATKLAERLAAAGHRFGDVARRLGVCTGTLSNWRARWRTDRLRPRPRGRPVEELDKDLARCITAALHLLGAFEGLPVLQSLFPQVARAELEERLRRYREDFVKANHLVVQALRWRRAGAVWAMDFVHAPAPIDGRFRHVLSVRDLASGKALLWLPLRRKTGLAVRDALRALFLEHGAPLVLKEDNDKAFGVAKVRKLLRRWKVEPLRSPPYMPEYNGACEAGIGTLKTYAHHQAARNDRPGQWSCDDVEAARRRANELSRPRGHSEPTPNELWRERSALSLSERRDFHEQLEQRRMRYLEQMNEENKEDLNEVDRAAKERRAMASVLVACGFLLVRRRRISPPFSSRFWSRIRG